MITLEKIPQADKDIFIDGCFLPYIAEINSFEKEAFVDGSGDFNIKDVGIYFYGSENEEPFYFKEGNKTVGFCLLYHTTDYLSGNKLTVINHFYILEEYRKKGYSKQCAKEIFKYGYKNIELTCFMRDVPAMKFWTKIMSEFSTWTDSVEYGKDVKFYFGTLLSERKEESNAVSKKGDRILAD